MRGRIGFDLRTGGFRLSPEFVMASEQDRTFTGGNRDSRVYGREPEGRYTLARQSLAHQFAAPEVFNIGDQLYRNHSSLHQGPGP